MQAVFSKENARYWVCIILLTAFPVLHLYGKNIKIVSFTNILEILSISLIVGIIVFVGLSLLLKDVAKASFLTTVSIILFFSYGHIYQTFVRLSLLRASNFLPYAILDALPFGDHRYLLPVWLLLWAVAIILMVRSNGAVDFLNSYALFFAIVLTLFPLIQIGFYSYQQLTELNSNEQNTEIVSQEFIVADAEFPDVYYIIFDGYAREDTLKTIFGLDNTPFLKSMEERGFYVAHQSTSNYAQTILSLNASLNMQYLTDSEDGTSETLMNNAVLRTFQANGYTYIHYSSGGGDTLYNIYADENVIPTSWNEFNYMFLGSTMFAINMPKTVFEEYRNTRLLTFEALAELPADPRPTFAFAHFLMPHPPYLFDRNGEFVDDAPDPFQFWTPKPLYVEQTLFVNKKIRELVDQLIARSETPPIIIIQADHGSATLLESGGEDWEWVITDEGIRERIGILSIYYVPNELKAQLYPSITPVNSFRLVSDYLFDTNMGLLEDRVFFSNYSAPFDFTEIDPQKISD